MTTPAVEDIRRLVKRDPQAARAALEKMLLLERDPRAGEPLLGELVGFRKLTVGDRHWRIVWRVTTGEDDNEVVEIAEVWAAGARADDEVYAEMARRVEALPASPKTRALADLVETLGRAAAGVTVAQEPTSERVPTWLVDRLVHTAGMAEDEVHELDAEEAMQRWEAFITRPRE